MILSLFFLFTLLIVWGWLVVTTFSPSDHWMGFIGYISAAVGFLGILILIGFLIPIFICPPTELSESWTAAVENMTPLYLR
jgi:hypothetical protein